MTVLGVQTPVTNVSLNGVGIPGSSVTYDGSSKALTITGLANMTSMGAFAAEWVLEWA